MRLQELDDLVEVWRASLDAPRGEGDLIADDHHHLVLGAARGDVEAVERGEEPDAPIGAHEVEDHDVVFAALDLVDGADLDHLREARRLLDPPRPARAAPARLGAGARNLRASHGGRGADPLWVCGMMPEGLAAGRAMPD